jgi:hypothetical protein
MAPKNPCLACAKECTGQQYSVHCTLCSLWCHKECAGISDAFFKNLELQIKEMGQSFWACRSWVSFASTFATKVNAKLKEVSDKVDNLQEKVEENTGGLEEAQGKINNVEKKVEKVEKTVEDMEKKVEEGMYEEMRAREAIKRNIVMYGVKEPDQNIKDAKDRMEADKEESERIFTAIGSGARKRDIRFCRRIGEKGEDWRPLLVGMTSETVKSEILDRAKELQNTMYKDVGIGPDQTRKQKQAEIRLAEEVKRKNREELTEQDKAKNLVWAVIGQRGEKRMVKVQERDNGGEWRTQTTRGRGRGRGRGAGTSDRGKRTRQDDEEEMEIESERRTRSKQ